MGWGHVVLELGTMGVTDNRAGLQVGPYIVWQLDKTPKLIEVCLILVLPDRRMNPALCAGSV